MKVKLGSIIIILMISISLISFAHADSIFIVPNYNNSDYDYTGHTNHQTTKLHTSSKHLTVGLTESINLKSNNNDQSLQNDRIRQVSTSNKIISLSDNLEIQTAHVDQKTVMIIAKEKPERVTTLEKISNIDRIRFTGRSIVVDNVQPTTQDMSSKSLPYEISIDRILNNKQANNLDQEINSLLKSAHAIIFSANKEFVVVTSVADKFGNDLLSFAHYVTPQNNQTLLVLLLPISGYILIRSENDRIKITNSRQFFSLFLIVILMSSSAITPLSISHSYWGMAFAENDTVPSNSTTPGISNSIQNQSNVVIPQNITLSIRQSNTTMYGQLVLQDIVSASLSNTTKSSLGNSPVNTTNSLLYQRCQG